MSRRRRNTSSPESDDNPPLKRQFTGFEEDIDDDGNSLYTDEKPTLDPISGQKSAFPGLGNDDELYYGPASNGLEYLRMVRSEAKTVPSLLTSKTSIEYKTTQVGGYYHDGAYTATNKRSGDDDEHQLPKAQQEYYKSILLQFRLLQATLRCLPSLEEVNKLDTSRIISFPPDSKTAREQWSTYIQKHDPHPVQIACMDDQSVMELLKLLKRKLIMLLKSDKEMIIKRLGVWIWTVLGKCRDRGELGSEEIGELRALAQKAADYIHEKDGDINLFDSFNKTNGNETINDCTVNEGIFKGSSSPMPDGFKMQDLAMAHSTFDHEEGGDTNHQRLEDQANLKCGLNDQMIMILDLIITIVGEKYGQLDLLAFRKPWITP